MFSKTAHLIKKLDLSITMTNVWWICPSPWRKFPPAWAHTGCIPTWDNMLRGEWFCPTFCDGLISSGTKHMLLYSTTACKKITRPPEVANAVQMHARILWGARGSLVLDKMCNHQLTGFFCVCWVVGTIGTLMRDFGWWVPRNKISWRRLPWSITQSNHLDFK